ncbi:MAG: 2-phosphosulfolactate phosphatase [Phycisphaerae bacterium]
MPTRADDRPLHVQTIHHPLLLEPHHLAGRSVVVFDVLRATTTMAVALSRGAASVRLFTSLESAGAAHAAFEGPKLLLGERECVKPDGFDLGNSPREAASADLAGRTLFMSTTNGTNALAACAGARRLYAGCVLNAAATARALLAAGNDVTLVCAGTRGQFADEDFAGAGLVIKRLGQIAANPGPAIAFADEGPTSVKAERQALELVFAQSAGGLHIKAAGLAEDLPACAAVDALNIVCRVRAEPLEAFAEG